MKEKETEMEKKGFTLVEILIVVVIVGILAAIVVPLFMRPDIMVYIDEINGKKELVYSVFDRYGYKRLRFRDVGLNGTLDSVEDYNGLISEPGMVAVRSAPAARVVSWNTWVDRFEQEIRPEAVGN